MQSSRAVVACLCVFASALAVSGGWSMVACSTSSRGGSSGEEAGSSTDSGSNGSSGSSNGSSSGSADCPPTLSQTLHCANTNGGECVGAAFSLKPPDSTWRCGVTNGHCECTSMDGSTIYTYSSATSVTVSIAGSMCGMYLCSP
jgi:hypothetical protein